MYTPTVTQSQNRITECKLQFNEDKMLYFFKSTQKYVILLYSVGNVNNSKTMKSYNTSDTVTVRAVRARSNNTGS